MEGIKRCRVHHQRDDLREQRAEESEDLEALCVEIAPVPDRALVEPGQVAQQLDLKAATEDRKGVGQRRQGEKDHFIFNHRATQTGTRQRDKLSGRRGNLHQRQSEPGLQRRVEQAQANERCFPAQAVAPLELLLAHLYSIGWQQRIKQMRENARMLLDELGMDSDRQLADV